MASRAIDVWQETCERANLMQMSCITNLEIKL